MPSQVVKFDVRSSDPEKAKANNFEPAPPRVYIAKPVSFEVTKPKSERTGKPDPKKEDMWVVVAEIQKPAGKYSRIWDRIVQSEASAWKTDQFLQCFGIANTTKRTGQFKPQQHVVGQWCKIRVVTDDGGYPKIAAWIPWNPDEDDEEMEDELEEDEELDDEDIEDDDVEESEDEEESEESDEAEYPHYDEDELTSMDLAGLKDVCSDLDLEPDAKTAKRKSALVAWILDNQPNQEGSEEEEEEDDGYDGLSDDELRAEMKDRELKFTAKTPRTKLIAALREDDSTDPFE